MNDISSNELFLYLEGEVTKRRSAEIDQHLESCRACRERLQRRREMIESLAEPDGELEGLDLVEDVRRLVEEQGKQPAKKRRKLPAVSVRIGLLLVALAGAVALWFATAEKDEFRVKSASPVVHEQDRWVGVQAFRLGEGDRPAPLSGNLGRGEFLLFAYTNQGESPFPYMMILAVDAGKRAHWFYPAYTGEGTDPRSIPIAGNVTGAELFEKIRHDFAPGPLHIYGLFTRKPLKVSEVEALIKGIEPGQRIPLKDSAQHILETAVSP
jgi:hypothetical protein